MAHLTLKFHSKPPAEVLDRIRGESWAAIEAGKDFVRMGHDLGEDNETIVARFLGSIRGRYGSPTPGCVAGRAQNRADLMLAALHVAIEQVDDEG